MIFRLALRNVLKNLPKRLPLAILFALTVALLFLGNTLFENTDQGFQRAYVQSFTGDLSVSVVSDSQFTIFGSDLPLIGEYFVLPVLPDYEKVKKEVLSLPISFDSISQVSAAGELALGNYASKVPVFGIDFPEYFRFFSALKVIRGSVPESGSSSIMINSSKFKEISKNLGREPNIGDSMTLSFALNNSFVIREVKLAGVYDYPVADEVLNRIVLTDVDTARALNGYIYGANEKVLLDDQAAKLISDDVESLFQDGSDVVAKNDGGITLSSVESDIAKNAQRNQLNKTVEGAWNFLLLHPKGNLDDAKSYLSSFLKKSHPDLQVRDWRETAGGNAQIVWLIRLLFNAGILFIAIGACLIVVNSLSLSIVERTKEIGTMRALGAQKSKIGNLVTLETVILVSGAGLIGVLMGTFAASLTSIKGIHVENQYLAALFGTDLLKLKVSFFGIFSHLFLCFVLGFAAVILPVRKALAIEPIRAMSRE